MEQLRSVTLRQKRADLKAQHEAICQTARQYNRTFSSGEREKLDRIESEVNGLEVEIRRAEAEERERLEQATPVYRDEDGEYKHLERQEVKKRSASYRAFDKYLRFGERALDSHELSLLRETRAQGVGTGSAGGYVVAEDFSRQLEASMKAYGGMRQAATVFSTDTGADLPWPTYDDTSNVGELTAENAAVNEQDVTFSQVVFKSYKYDSKLVKVSVELLQDSAFDLQAELARIFGERIGRITNTHFTTGDNSGKPQGVVTGASSAFTAASPTAITADELIRLFHSVDPAYRVGPKVFWMFNDSTLEVIRKLKDANGQYLWQPGLRDGEQSLLLGKPYIINQDMANIATGTKPILFGDFSKYRIRDVRPITVLRLNERYAENLQVGFIAFSRHDGRLLDAGTDPLKFITMA